MGGCTSRLGWVALTLAAAWSVACVSVRAEDAPARMDRIVFDEKGLSVTSPDESVRFNLGGRLHLDPGLGAARPPAGIDFNDFAIRRAWLEPSLVVGRFIAALQYDFADPRTPVNDAVVAYRGFAPLLVTLGNFKEPFSLQQLVSNNDTTFIERGLPDALVPARNFGLALAGHAKRWTLAGGVFGGNINTSVERGGLAGTARATYAPILAEDEVLHLGAAGSVRAYDRDDRSPSFDSRPEADNFATALIDTDTIRNADRLARLGLEAAYQRGPFRLQAEYIQATVERREGRGSATLSGAYVEAALVLNGQGRPYTLVPAYGTTYAVFGGVKVPEADRVSQGGTGVFEVAGRFSILDLKDADIRGGVERNWTAGLNWYPEPNLRLSANYVRARAEGGPLALRAVEADIGAFRIQFYW